MKLSQDAKETLAWQARRELVKRYAEKEDILNWGVILFPHLFYVPFCQEMHQYFVDIRYDDFTVTEAPREYGKTLVMCFLIPLFIALEKPKMYNYYLNIQKTSTKAKMINILIQKEIETNSLLIDVYGAQYNRDKWNEKQFVLMNGVIFGAAGSGESVRGLLYLGKRPDYVIADDLYDEEDIHNLESTKKITEWFWSTLYSAIASTKRRAIRVQGTAINNEDILYTIKGKAADLKTLKIRCKTFQAILDEDKQIVLWPEFKSWDVLMDEKNVLMGMIIFNRERMNVRSSDEESIIKLSYIKYYDEIPEGKKVVRKVGACDPSIGDKEKKNNDDTGLAAVYEAEIPDAPGIFDYYIEDVIMEKLTQNDRINTLENFNEAHNLDEMRIEAIAGFGDFAREAKRRTDANIKIIDHVKDKITNLEQESPKFENGRVWIKRSIPLKVRNKLVEQLTNNKPKHDDGRDAVLIAMRKKKKGTVTVS